jgi:hypothetical protein
LEAFGTVVELVMIAVELELAQATAVEHYLPLNMELSV